MNNFLSKRLQKVASLAGECDVLADIGCDHGYLSAYFAENSKAKVILASDISENSLKKAREHCKEYGNVSFFVGNGFAPLPQRPDVAVIAGMGGDEIASMLTDEKAKCKLVMQPMRDSSMLYKALVENGFYIEEVCAVEDCGRIYEIIVASQGKDSEFDYSLPPLDRLVIDEDALKLLEFKRRITEEALLQAEKSDNGRAKKRAEELKDRAERIYGVIAYAESKRDNRFN